MEITVVGLRMCLKPRKDLDWELNQATGYEISTDPTDLRALR